MHLPAVVWVAPVLALVAGSAAALADSVAAALVEEVAAVDADADCVPLPVNRRAKSLHRFAYKGLSEVRTLITPRFSPLTFPAFQSSNHSNRSRQVFSSNCRLIDRFLAYLGGSPY